MSELCGTTRRNDARTTDDPGWEPVVPLAFLEHQLQSAESCHEQAEPGPVDVTFLANQVRRILDEARDKDQVHYTDGHIDVKDPRPGELIGEPSAQRGTKCRPQHCTETV